MPYISPKPETPEEIQAISQGMPIGLNLSQVQPGEFSLNLTPEEYGLQRIGSAKQERQNAEAMRTQAEKSLAEQLAQLSGFQPQAVDSSVPGKERAIATGIGLLGALLGARNAGQVTSGYLGRRSKEQSDKAQQIQNQDRIRYDALGKKVKVAQDTVSDAQKQYEEAQKMLDDALKGQSDILGKEVDQKLEADKQKALSEWRESLGTQKAERLKFDRDKLQQQLTIFREGKASREDIARLNREAAMARTQLQQSGALQRAQILAGSKWEQNIFDNYQQAQRLDYRAKAVQAQKFLDDAEAYEDLIAELEKEKLTQKNQVMRDVIDDSIEKNNAKAESLRLKAYDLLEKASAPIDEKVLPLEINPGVLPPFGQALPMGQIPAASPRFARPPAGITQPTIKPSISGPIGMGGVRSTGKIKMKKKK